MLYPSHMPSAFNPFPHFYSPQNLLNSPSPQFQGLGAPAENDVHGADDFCVDELLDLSSGYETEEQQVLEELPPEIDEMKMTPVLGEKIEAPRPEFEALRETELAVQAEGLESLEWLSHFVEDSFSDYSVAAAAVDTPAAASAQEQPYFITPVHTKARTKRARSGPGAWPVLSSSFTDSPTSSSSSTSFSTTSFPPSVSTAVTKKQRKKPTEGGGQPRRCTHCGVTKTPQWRAGPLGAKTLCNACGVRFKSGRLLPEYRPACSPTFSSELHSNNHRKVLEMRRKKEDDAGLPPPVQSF